LVDICRSHIADVNQLPKSTRLFRICRALLECEVWVLSDHLEYDIVISGAQVKIPMGIIGITTWVADGNVPVCRTRSHD